MARFKKEKTDVQISFRVTESDFKVLQEAASSVGLMTSTFCRAIVLQNKGETVLWVGNSKSKSVK